jgi:hypothetical protein
MRLRVAKGIALARSCGHGRFGCRHNWDQIQKAFIIVARAMRRGSRLISVRSPEFEFWTDKDKRSAGLVAPGEDLETEAELRELLEIEKRVLAGTEPLVSSEDVLH